MVLVYRGNKVTCEFDHNDLRIRFTRSIGPDDGSEVGIAKQEGVVALVGLEVLRRIVSWSGQPQREIRQDILCSSRRMSLPMVN